jgi:hypothetical protein
MSVRRRLFTFLATLSLLLFVATCILWLRSLRQYDVWASTVGGWEMASERGRVSLEWGRRRQWGKKSTAGRTYRTGQVDRSRPAAVPFGEAQLILPGFQLRRIVELTGISYAAGAMSRDVKSRVTRRCDVHYWLLMIVTATLPATVGFSRLREARRSRIGMCKRCGYDLRATPERCPECGATPATR